MTLLRTLLTTATLLFPLVSMVHASPMPILLSGGSLKDLNGVSVGRASIERQGNQLYVHVTDARKAAGATLELLVSSSTRALKSGDPSGPGTDAVLAGLVEQAEVRYVLPASVRSGSLRSVWVWCRSVGLPSAQARLSRRSP